MNKPNGVDVAKIVSDSLNCINDTTFIGEFVYTMSRDHRTLQQAFTRLCVAWIKDLAEREKEQCYDARNEASVKLAKEIVKLGDDKLFLPFI